MYAPLLAEAAPPFNRTLKYYAWTESDGLPISSGYANYDTLGDTVPARDVTTLIHTDGPDSVNRAYSTTLYPSNSAAPSWGAGHAHDYASDGATDGIYLYSTIFIRCEWAMVYV